MRHEFRLADIGEGLEEAEIISWLVAVGDTVRRDQPLVEVMTDKSNAELPAPTNGTIVSLSGEVGDIITVGELIAVIDEAETADAPPAPSTVDPAEQVDAVSADPVPHTPPVLQAVSPAPATTAPATIAPATIAPATIAPATIAPATIAPAVSPAPSVTPPSTSMIDAEHAPRTKAAPSTRRAAAERGIDLATVSGSGPGGRILLSDLDTPTAAPPTTAPPTLAAPAPAPIVVTPPSAAAGAAAAAPASVDFVQQPPAPPPIDETRPTGTIALRGIRRAVAQNMAKSWSEIPHIHAFEHIDAEPLLEMRSRLRDTKRPGYQSLTPLAFFVAAVARSLGAHPEANASINMTDETITYHPTVNVGVAVAAENGLVVPVLQAAEQLDFETLSLTLTQLVRGAREAQLSREHYLGGTVTITNFGSLGGEQAAPLIRPPEALILGFGSIADRPFVIDGQVVARKTMHLVAGADHRLLDGDVTTSILSMVAAFLSDPLELVI